MRADKLAVFFVLVTMLSQQGGCPIEILTSVEAFTTLGTKWSLLRRQGKSVCSESAESGVDNPGFFDEETSNLVLERLQKSLYGPRNSVSPSQGWTQRLPSASGLSKFHRSILSTTSVRQRCVTGEYPLTITVSENPTRKWLGSTRRRMNGDGLAHCQMLVNGTSVDRSLASYDRFQWLDEEERNKMHEKYALLSLELVAEINVRKPGYLNILPKRAAGSSATAFSRFDKKFQFDSSLLLNELERQHQDGERLWITGFSLTKQSGEMHYLNLDTCTMGQVNSRTADAIRWPNEVHIVPKQNHSDDEKTQPHNSNSAYSEPLEDALLVSDGFLVPGKDNGGLYVVRNPGNEKSEWHVCLAGGSGVDGLLNKLENTKKSRTIKQSNLEDALIDSDVGDSGWFYHRAIWIDLTGDGRLSILTARAKRPSFLKQQQTPSQQQQNQSTKAQLVWIERPKPYRYDEETGTPLDIDDTVFDPFSSRHTPWKVRVLDEGPDVMFSVADLDPDDDTIEVIASQFFNGKITLHSIKKGPEPRVVFRRTIDDNCGPSFSSILADLDGEIPNESNLRPKVIDCGSTVNTIKSGESFSHLLVTNHKCSVANEDEKSNEIYFNAVSIEQANTNGIEENDNNHYYSNNGKQQLLGSNQSTDGGSLFSYRVPLGKGNWKTEPWIRSIIATGFRVRGQLGNMINPGAPGFCYTFFPTRNDSKKNEKNQGSVRSRPLIGIAGDCAEAAYILRPVEDTHNNREDPSSNYVMMCEIDCGATVGSIGIGYDDIGDAEQESGYAKIYIPCYEKDKILVFAMGTGEDNSNDDW